MNKIIKYIIIAIIIFLSVGVLEIIIFSQRKESDKEEKGNSYNFTSNVVEEKGITIYSSPQLKAAHCLNSVCIENASFYYNEKGGRVEYIIHNQSNTIYDGFIKMVFNEQSLVISIRNLAPGQSVKSSSYYLGVQIKEKDDYQLQELTEEDKSKIVRLDSKEKVN